MAGGHVGGKESGSVDASATENDHAATLEGVESTETPGGGSVFFLSLSFFFFSRRGRDPEGILAFVSWFPSTGLRKSFCENEGLKFEVLKLRLGEGGRGRVIVRGGNSRFFSLLSLSRERMDGVVGSLELLIARWNK